MFFNSVYSKIYEYQRSYVATKTEQREYNNIMPSRYYSRTLVPKYGNYVEKKLRAIYLWSSFQQKDFLLMSANFN